MRTVLSVLFVGVLSFVATIAVLVVLSALLPHPNAHLMPSQPVYRKAPEWKVRVAAPEEPIDYGDQGK